MQGPLLLGWLIPQASGRAQSQGRDNLSASSSPPHHGDWAEGELRDSSQAAQDTFLELFKWKQGGGSPFSLGGERCEAGTMRTTGPAWGSVGREG